MRLFPLLLVGCFSGRTVAPSPPEVPAEPEPPTVPASASPTVELAPVPGAPPAEDEIASRLSPSLASRIREVKSAFDGATSAGEVAAAWRRSLELATALEEALGPAYEASDYEPLDLAWLLPSLPGMRETYMAEGMALVFVLDSDLWKQKAATTAEPADDTFFDLLHSAWGAARPMGWPTWEQRTWDYGGCSALGQGVVLDVLTKVDIASAAGSDFQPELAEQRARALKALTEDHPEFPRCNVNSLEPTDTASIRAEVDAILDRVQLSRAEQAMIRARRAALTGQAHKGG